MQLHDDGAAWVTQALASAGLLPSDGFPASSRISVSSYAAADTLCNAGARRESPGVALTQAVRWLRQQDERRAIRALVSQWRHRSLEALEEVQLSVADRTLPEEDFAHHFFRLFGAQAVALFPDEHQATERHRSQVPVGALHAGSNDDISAALDRLAAKGYGTSVIDVLGTFDTDGYEIPAQRWPELTRALAARFERGWHRKRMGEKNGLVVVDREGFLVPLLGVEGADEGTVNAALREVLDVLQFDDSDKEEALHELAGSLGSLAAHRFLEISPMSNDQLRAVAQRLPPDDDGRAYLMARLAATHLASGASVPPLPTL